MKITKEQYEKALAQLPKLMKAQRIVEDWEQGLEILGEKLNGMEMVALEFDDNGAVTASCRPLPEANGQAYAPADHSPEEADASVA